jgi:hypothetical protein
MYVILLFFFLESLSLSSAYSTWSQSSLSSYQFHFHFTIPPSIVFFIPSPGQAIKFAFIQWLAMFWLLYFGMKFIRDFVFVQGIVDTQRIRDTTPLEKQHQF